jgi:hypothetical protein
MRKIPLAIGVAALLAGACARTGPQDVSQPRLDPLEGPVEIVQGGEARLVTEPVDLEPGDLVRTGSGGRALLRFPGSQSLEAAPRAELAVGPSGPELMGGSALVRSSSGLPVRVGEIEVKGGDSLYRLDRGVALRVGVYQGGVTLPGSGFEGTVPGLREAVVTAGIVAREPRPLSVDPADAWDTRLLGEAIDIGLDLERLEDGLSRQLPRRGARATLQEVLPEPLSPRRALSMVRDLSPATGLVASAVATRLAADQAMPALAALGSVVDEVRLGASWTVVMARWEVARGELLSALARISDLVVRALAPPPPDEVGPAGDSTGGSTAGGSTSGGSGGSSTASSGDTSGGGSDGGGGGGDGGGDGGGGGNEPTPPGCTDLVECTVEGVIGDGGLGGLGS